MSVSREPGPRRHVILTRPASASNRAKRREALAITSALRDVLVLAGATPDVSYNDGDLREDPSMDQESVSDLRARLREAAETLRSAPKLDDASRGAVAELLAELGDALQSTSLPAGEVAHLSECTTHLAESLRHGRDRGILAGARDRFAKAFESVESRAPVAVGIARQFVDILANLGI
jgi:hypothetical protein